MLSGPIKDFRSFEIALNAMPVGVSWATLADQKIVFMNRKFTEIFGYVVDDFPVISDWINHYPFEADRDFASERWAEYFLNPNGLQFQLAPMELRIRCKDGTVKTIIHAGIILPGAGWALATFVDISVRKRDEIFLREAARQARENQLIYQTLLDHAPEMIVLFPFDQSRRYVSPAVSEITGFTQAEYLTLKPADICHPADLPRSQEILAGLRRTASTTSFRYRAAQKDGSYRWVEAAATSYVDPVTQQPAGLVITVRDIAGEVERQKDMETEHRRLAEAATHDELTGIPNRRAFNQALVREASRMARSDRGISLLLIDVDHFKLYNDHWGHLEGDACLWLVAQAIHLAVGRVTDLVARFGGEEFVVLAPMTDACGIAMIAQNIIDGVASMELPHPKAKGGIVTVSIGGTTAPAGVRLNQVKLVEHADRGLYIAKAEGRNTFRSLPFELA